MSTFLLAGFGSLAAELGAKLCESGHEVWGLRRDAARILPPVKPIAGDLCAPQTLGDVPLDIDYLVYTATPGAFEDGAYERAYVQGLKNLLALWKGANMRERRLLYVSSTSVYGQQCGEVVNEDSATQPRGFSGKRLLEGERVALSSSWRASIVRFGGIYGPGRTRLIDRARAGASCRESPPLFTNRIHQDDCVGVMHHVLQLPAPDTIYVAVDNESAPQCVVMDWLAQRLAAPTPVRIAASDTANRGPGSKRCDNSRLRASGYNFIYPTFREGYADML